MKPCTHCGELFEPKYPNMKLCLDCWKEREQAFELLDELRADLRRLESHGRAIPPDMHRVLILLCHPDKHGDSPAATKATQWLLANRP